ncbi:MAG: hypothetical protein WAX14_19545 [Rhodococcus sp. (in: high G+C Gram-positive bacteria)]|uniref:hypothetical protein n=1 Tax=Rhodococcus sp. TaxID=1831 RepID=UPI003BB69EE4
MWPTHWPATAREIAQATDSALSAARTGDAPAFADAVAALTELPYEQVTAVHAGMVRELLEELHPDGLAGDDVRAVIERCARGRAVPVAPHVLVAVLTGTLGVADPEVPTVRPEQYLTAGLVVLVDLLASRAADPGPYVRRAVGEIERSETIEMP